MTIDPANPFDAVADAMMRTFAGGRWCKRFPTRAVGFASMYGQWRGVRLSLPIEDQRGGGAGQCSLGQNRDRASAVRAFFGWVQGR